MGKKSNLFALEILKPEPRGKSDFIGNRLSWATFDRPFTIPGSCWRDQFWIFCAWRFLRSPIISFSWAKGYAENLKNQSIQEILNFMWCRAIWFRVEETSLDADEFLRHNAGEFRSRDFSKYPVVHLLANWEIYGALNGGYGRYSREEKLPPVVAKAKTTSYFKTPISGPTSKAWSKLLSLDYGPINNFLNGWFQ